MTHRQLYILGVRVDDISCKQALSKVEEIFASSAGKFFIVTPNPEICLYGTVDEHYRRDILDKAYLSLPDGFGLSIAAWIFGERLRNRVTGVDFTYALMKRAAKNGWHVFLFGGKNVVAARCAEILQQKYKRLDIAGTAQGKMSNDQCSMTNQIPNPNDQILLSINASKADILFVALGAPKQEYWIAENLSKLPSVRIAVGVGGTFDFVAGKIQRAPKILRRAGLEWLWRLIVQPWRLPRIYNATIKFLFMVCKWRWRMWFIYRPNVVGLILKDDKVLLVERSDEPGHWQLPQGGIEKGENAREAFLREMREELGTDALVVMRYVPSFFRYTWPKMNQLMQGYRGQRQDLFIAEFAEKSEDIILDQEELVAYRWILCDEAVSFAHPLRREQITRALSFLH